MSFFQNIDPLEDLPFDIDQRISNKAKHMALRVNYMTGRIELVIPKRASMRSATQFVLHHQDWIEEKQQTIPQSIPFENGVSIPLFGQSREISITWDTNIKQTSLSLEETTLNVRTYLDDPSQRIRRALKKIASTRYEEMAHQKSTSINAALPNISVRDTKSRWGSCSRDGQISFSWRLIFAPMEAMDYVIAHEVAHLQHMNHSPAFWKLCESLCLDYKPGKLWMKEHGHTLMRYGRTIL